MSRVIVTLLTLLMRRSVPATYASFPIFHQLFARLGMDDNIETNVSTFAAEMREIAFILRNIDRRSLSVESIYQMRMYIILTSDKSHHRRAWSRHEHERWVGHCARYRGGFGFQQGRKRFSLRLVLLTLFQGFCMVRDPLQGPCNHHG